MGGRPKGFGFDYGASSMPGQTLYINLGRMWRIPVAFALNPYLSSGMRKVRIESAFRNIPGSIISFPVRGKEE